MPRRTKGRLYKRGRNYWADFQVNGERVREALRDENGKPITTKTRAQEALERRVHPYTAKNAAERHRLIADRQRHLEELAAIAEEQARPKQAIAEAWEKYEASPTRPDAGESTLRQYKFQWGRFTDWAEGQELKHLEEITPDHAAAYAVDLGKAGLAASTYNKHVGLLKLLYRTIMGTRTTPFDEITRKKGNGSTRREFSLAVLNKIFDAAEGELKLLCALGLYTGQRLGDCCSLDWAAVDLAKGWIQFEPAKTYRRTQELVDVPIVAPLRALLEDIPKDWRTGFVVPTLATEYANRTDLVTDHVMELLRAVGVQPYKPGTGPGTKKRAVLQYGFHSLRHSTVSILAEAGVPAAVVEAITGHRSEAVRRRYEHIGRRAIRTAFEALPDVNGTATRALPEADIEPERAKLAELAHSLPIATVREILRTVSE